MNKLKNREKNKLNWVFWKKTRRKEKKHEKLFYKIRIGILNPGGTQEWWVKKNIEKNKKEKNLKIYFNHINSILAMGIQKNDG